MSQNTTYPTQRSVVEVGEVVVQEHDKPEPAEIVPEHDKPEPAGVVEIGKVMVPENDKPDPAENALEQGPCRTSRSCTR